MAKPPKKIKIPKFKPPVYDYAKYGQPWQQPLGTTPGARNVPFTVKPDPTIGTPFQRPLTGTPGGTPWSGVSPTGAGTKAPWWKLTGKGAGVGGKIGQLAKLGGRITPWGAAAIGLASGGAELWKALTPEFQAYVDAGGAMGQMEWQRAGRPATPQESGELGALTDLGKAGFGETVRGLPVEEQMIRMQAEIARKTDEEKVKAEEAAAEDDVAVEWDTIIDPDTQMIVAIAKNAAGKIVDYQPTGQFARQPESISPYQQAQLDWEKQQATESQAWQERLWAREEQQAQQKMDLEREVFGWQQKVREQELGAERNRQLAQLRANPASWLEYASLAGQTPQIQPWMLPLMPQQYAGSQAGGAIPGYQAGGEKMNLPELVTPSAQYMSRISPSARQQYYGYEGARTGQSASDVDWRLWSQAPPGGRYPGLRRFR